MMNWLLFVASFKLCSIIIITMNFVPFLTLCHLSSTISQWHSCTVINEYRSIETGECQLKRMTCSGESSSTIDISNPKPKIIRSHFSKPATYTSHITHTIYIVHFTYTNEKWTENIFVYSVLEKENKQKRSEIGAAGSNWQSDNVPTDANDSWKVKRQKKKMDFRFGFNLIPFIWMAIKSIDRNDFPFDGIG